MFQYYQFSLYNRSGYFHQLIIAIKIIQRLCNDKIDEINKNLMV